MRKRLVLAAALVALAAVLWLWPRHEPGLTPAAVTDGDWTVTIERYEIWTDTPPPPETPPPQWLQRLRRRLGVRNSERPFYSVSRQQPAAEGTRSGWVRLTVTGPGAGNASAVQLHLLTEDPPDRTPMGSGSHSLSPDSLLVDADFVIAGDGAIRGLKVTVGEKSFLFQAR